MYNLDLGNRKRQFRKETRSKLNNQTLEEALAKSRAIKEKLFRLSEFKLARLVMLYASMEDEVSTKDMIEEALEMGKRVVLPRSVGQEIVPKEIKKYADLEKASFGIYQPREELRNVNPKEIDLVIVPGVAFDEKNTRLGRGKGCYDRFLSKLPGDKVTVGLAFDFQIVQNLPKDSHDIPVSKVLTN